MLFDCANKLNLSLNRDYRISRPSEHIRIYLVGFWRQWNEQSTARWRASAIKMWIELEGRYRSVGRRQSGHPAKSTDKVTVGASSFSMLFVLLLVKLQLLLHSKFHFLLLVRWKFILFGGHVDVLFWCCFLVFFLIFL